MNINNNSYTNAPHVHFILSDSTRRRRLGHSRRRRRGRIYVRRSGGPDKLWWRRRRPHWKVLDLLERWHAKRRWRCNQRCENIRHLLCRLKISRRDDWRWYCGRK